MCSSDEGSYTVVVAAPFAALGVRLQGDALASIEFLSPDVPERASGHPAVTVFRSFLSAYLENPRAVLPEFPFPVGTPFQSRVWAALAAIPVGETETYGGLARRLGSAPRAVGQACGANPLPILIPCHRVVAAQGLGGFMNYEGGPPLAIKKWLLDHERSGRRVS